MPVDKKQGRSAPLCYTQNYLTSSATIRNILNRTNINSTDHVLEIGPGKGHITRALLRRCGRVTAVELDSALSKALRERFADEKTLCLVHQDFLRFKLPTSGRYKVFANIPFNRTTEILRKLTEVKNPPCETWLVVEKGAALRFMGRPRETVRSLLLKPYFDPEIVYSFKREDFHPMPGVDAVLLHLKKKQEPDITAAQSASYRMFIEGAFEHGGSGLRRFLARAPLSRILKTNDMTPSHLLYVQWLCLFRRWPE